MSVFRHFAYTRVHQIRMPIKNQPIKQLMSWFFVVHAD